MLCTFDIETASNGALLDIGLYYDNAIFKTFQSWETFLFYLSNVGIEQGEFIELWAHNGGKFDSVSLIIEIFRNPELSHLVAKYPTPSLVNGKVLFCDIELTAGRTVKILDSMSHFQTSLEKFLKAFDVQNKTEIDKTFYHRMQCFKALHPEKYYTYLENDCKGLYEAISKYKITLFDAFGYEKNLPPSAAGLAKKIYFKNFAPSDRFYFPSSEGREFAFTRAAFAGGRTEFIGSGKKNNQGIYENCNYYDVNSFYPSIMKDGFFPITKGIRTKRLEYTDDGKLATAIYHVKFEQRTGAIEFLRPFDDRGRRQGKTALSGEGYFTNIEIDHLLKLGGSVSVIDGFYYDETKQIFKDYINNIYHMRLESRAAGNGALAEAAKLLMNSLAGKFGEAPYGTNLYYVNFEELEQIYINYIEDENFKVIKMSEEDDNGYMCVAITASRRIIQGFPAISALVTAHARTRLSAMLENYAAHVIYCDTDSIILQNAELDPRLIDPDKLGLFKTEHYGVDMMIWGRKGYAMIDKSGVELRAEIKNKGIPKNLLKLHHARSIVNGDKITVDYRSPSGIKSALKTNVRFANEFLKRTRQVKGDLCSFELGKVRLENQIKFNPADYFTI